MLNDKNTRKSKSRVLNIRVTEKEYQFLKETSMILDITISELVRRVISYFFMLYAAYTLNKVKPPKYKELLESLKNLNI